MKNLRYIVAIALSTILFACVKSIPTQPVADDKQVMCTLDAKQCPDGSWVGRTGNKCEFVCPAQK